MEVEGRSGGRRLPSSGDVGKDGGGRGCTPTSPEIIPCMYSSRSTVDQMGLLPTKVKKIV
jgi:hypothetical protein